MLKWWKPKDGEIIEGTFVRFATSMKSLAIVVADANGEEIHIGGNKVLIDKLVTCWKELAPLKTSVRIQFEGKQAVKSEPSHTCALFRLWLDGEEIFSKRDFGRPLATEEVEKIFAAATALPEPPPADKNNQ